MVLANLLLANETVAFLKQARRHVGSLHNVAMIGFLVSVTIPLFVLFVRRLPSLNEGGRGPKRRLLVQSVLLGLIVVDAVYWLVAFIIADSACIECSEGQLPFLFFWVKRAWLY